MKKFYLSLATIILGCQLFAQSSLSHKPSIQELQERKKKIENASEKKQQRASYQSQKDSVCYWGWDAPGSTWTAPLGKITYTRDPNGNPLSEEYFTKTASGWRKNMLIQRTYDASNNVLSEINSNWDTIGLVYVNYSQVLSTYDASNNLLSGTYQDSSGTGWINSMRSSSTFDAANNQLTFLREQWVSGAWQNQYINLYTYDANNNLLLDEMNAWNTTSSVWDNGNLQIYTYDVSNNCLSSLRKGYSGTVYVNQDSLSYTYDSNNNRLSQMQCLWGGASWDNYQLFVMVYDASNNMISSNWKEWSGGWVNFAMDTYTFDSNNNLTQWLDQLWDDLGGVWYNWGLFEWTFDGNNNTTSYATWTSATATTWVGQAKYFYNYDVYDNLVGEKTQAWDFTASFWKNSDSTHHYFTTNSLVWPGDTDNDRIVDNNDLLPIGLYYGATGATRTVPSNLWQADTCANWGFIQAGGAELKHVDCNGDGIIDANDTLAVNLNFSLSHSIIPNNSESRSSNPNLYLVSPGSFYYPGDWVDAEVWLGTSSNPVSSLYGISFNINYDANLVQPGTESMTFNSSWLGTPGINAIKISKADAPSSTLYAAETRINHNDASGFGKIATFRFQVKTTLLSPDSINLNIASYNAIDALGNPQTFNTIPLTLDLVGVQDIEKENGITIFPNPYYNQTQINYLLNKSADVRIEVYNALGQNIETLLDEKQSAGQYKCIFSAKEKGYDPGVYFIKIIIDGKSTSMKVIELK